MKRRAFIRAGCVYSWLIWLPRSVLADRFPPAALASARRPAGGGGSCETQAQTQTDNIGALGRGEIYHAFKFTAASSFTCCKITLRGLRNVLDTSDILFEVRDHNAGADEPGSTVLGTSSTIPNASIGTTEQDLTATIDVALTNTTTYWLARKKVGITAGQSFTLRVGNGSPERVMYSEDAVTWTLQDTTRQPYHILFSA